MLASLNQVYDRIRRIGLDAPGYSHLGLPADTPGRELRAIMITVGDYLVARVKADLGLTMNYCSLGRVDQRHSTRVHFDGAPPHIILILGYEPSAIHSTVAVVDYPRYCRDHGLTIPDFLAHWNPMHGGAHDFSGYHNDIAGFDPRQANVIVINNSSSDCARQGMCGLMHVAKVEPGEGPRVINTVTLADLTGTIGHALGEQAKQRFIDLEVVGAAYDDPFVDNPSQTA